MNHTLRALATIAVCLPAAVAARGAERAAFLAAHCIKCHGAEAQEGGVRLDDLAAEITTVEMAERWQKVLNVLNASEMPPADGRTSQRLFPGRLPPRQSLAGCWR